MIDSGDQVFGEWAVERTAVTGRLFAQTYAGRLVAENGKIKFLRESLDLVGAARAMLPNGVSDIPLAPPAAPHDACEADVAQTPTTPA